MFILFGFECDNNWEDAAVYGGCEDMIAASTCVDDLNETAMMWAEERAYDVARFHILNGETADVITRFCIVREVKYRIDIDNK